MKNHYKQSLLLIFSFLFIYNSYSQTTYYLKSTGGSALTTTTNWGTNTDGTGTTPNNFNAANQIFVISNVTTASLTGTWSLNGSGSKVVLGTASNAAITFSVTGSGNLNGTIDIANASSGTNTLSLGNANIPTFGTLSSGSTVDYASNSTQTVTSRTYANLVMSGTGVKTAAGNITLGNSNTFVISSTATFDIGSYQVSFGSSCSLTVNGTFRLAGGNGFTGQSYTTVVNTNSPTVTVATGSTIEYNGSGSQLITPGNYYNLTSSNSGARTFTVSTTYGIAGTFTQGTNSYSSNYNTTFDFNGSGSQTIPAFSYFHLTSSNSGARTLASSGTIYVEGNFTPGSNSYTNTGSTINFNGSGSTIPAFSYYNLTSSGGGNPRSLASSGTIYISGVFTPGTNYWASIAGSTINFNGSGAQTIPAFNYNNLTSSSTGSRTLASSGTIGIAGTFTPGTNTYTITGSTIDYNGSGAQTILVFDYNNLTSSNSGSRTLPSTGTINVAGVFTPYGATYTITGSTVNFNGSGSQTIPAFNYYNLSSTNSGARTLSASGTVGVAGSFTPGSNSYTITNSIVDYNGSGPETITAFNYYNLTSSSSGTRTLAGSGTIGVASAFTPGTNTYTITGSTIDYNGTANQTIVAFNYNNLTSSSSGQRDLVSSGTIGVAGSFTPGTNTYANINNSTVNYNGSGASTITAFNYYNLTSSSTGARTLPNGSTVGVAAVFTPGTNSYTITGSTVNFNGTNMSTIPAFNYYNLTSSSSGNRALGSGIIGVYNVFTPGSNYYSSVSGSTVDFNGNGNQTIPVFTYNSVTASNAGTKTAAGAITINGLLTVATGITVDMVTYALSGASITSSGTGTLKTQNTTTTPLPVGRTWSMDVLYNSSSAQTIVNGSYTNINGTGGNRTLSTSTINIAGTFTTGAGTYTITSSTVNFNASGTQTIPAFTFNNLTNTNTGSTLSGNVTVNTTLDLQTGIITTGANTLTVASAGAINNASSLKYIDGKLARVYSATGSKVFPIGKGGNYRPVTFNYTALSGTSTVTMEQFESALGGTIPSTVSLYTARYWTITQSGGSAFQYKVSLDPTGFSPTATVVMVKSDAGTGTSNATTTPNYTNNSNFTALSSPSSFALGENNTATSTTAASPAAITYGATSVSLSATVSPNPGAGTVQFYIDGSSVGSAQTVVAGTGIATLSYNPATLSAGTHTIRADFSGYGAFGSSSSNPSANGTLTINAKALTITANNQSKTYGAALTLGTSAFSTSGLVNSDAVSTVTLTSTGAAASANAGTYSIVPSAASGTGLSNYTISYSNGTLTVNTKALTITANDRSKTYGTTLTMGTSAFTSNGLVNGNTVTSATLTSSGAASGAAAGSYSIVPGAANGTGLSNYTISYVNGTLTVDPVAVGGTISASQTVCSGNFANDLTLSGQTGSVVKWQKSLSSNFTTGVTDITNTTTTLTGSSIGRPTATTYIRALIQSGTTSSAYSDTVMLTIVTTNTWTGTVSKDWNDAGNWSCGIIPNGNTEDVTIASAAVRMPSLGANTSIRDLTLQSGATLSIKAYALSVYGNISGAGVLKGSASSALIFNGNGITTAVNFDQSKNDTSNVLTSLTVSGSSAVISVNNKLILLDSLSVTAGTLTVNDTIVLRSDINNTARVAPVGGSIAYGTGGKFVVERYIPTNRAWRLMTSPLSHTGSIYDNWQNGGNYKSGKGTLITGPGPSGTNGLDVSTQNNASLKKYVIATGAFASVTNTKTTLLSDTTGSSANQAYFMFIRGDRNPVNTSVNDSNLTTLSSAGKLQVGTQTMVASSTAGGYTLVGNPYASPVDFNHVSRTNIVKRFYFWDPTLSQVGGYVVLDDLDGDGIFSRSVLSPQDKDIQSGQAIFVQTIAAGAASISFDETSKSGTNNTDVFRPMGSSQPSFRTSLFLLDNNGNTKLADGTLAEFNDGYTMGVTIEDPLKFGNTNENLAMLRNGRALAVERRPLLKANDTLFLKLTTTSVRNYQFEFVTENLSGSGNIALLEDSYLGTSTLLNMEGSTRINFAVTSAAASAAATRFRIVFRPLQVVPVTFKSIKAAAKNETIKVEWTVDNEVNIKQYEVERSADGSHFTKATEVTAVGNGAGNNYSWLDNNPSIGANYYRVKGIEQSGATKYSDIVKVTMGKISSHIKLASYSVPTGTVVLTMTSQPKGSYTLRLLNMQGQVLSANVVEYGGGSGQLTIEKGNAVAAGAYIIEVNDPAQQKTILQLLL